MPALTQSLNPSRRINAPDGWFRRGEDHAALIRQQIGHCIRGEPDLEPHPPIRRPGAQQPRAGFILVGSRRVKQPIGPECDHVEAARPPRRGAIQCRQGPEGGAIQHVHHRALAIPHRDKLAIRGKRHPPWPRAARQGCHRDSPHIRRIKPYLSIGGGHDQPSVRGEIHCGDAGFVALLQPVFPARAHVESLHPGAILQPNGQDIAVRRKPHGHHRRCQSGDVAHRALGGGGKQMHRIAPGAIPGPPGQRDPLRRRRNGIKRAIILRANWRA